MSQLLFTQDVYDAAAAGQGLHYRGNVLINTCADTEALPTAIARYNPDVVFVGLDSAAEVETVCTGLKAAHAQLKVVVVLRDGGDATVLEAIRQGCDGCHLGAPNAKALLDTAARLLGIAVREKVRVLARIYAAVTGGGEAERHFGTIVDISVSGIRMESDARLETGEIVGIEFFLPGSTERCSATARVVRPCDDIAGYGLAFEAFEGSARLDISDFVERRNRRQ